MKATCKLCGALIETPVDPVFDEERPTRERTAFFQAIAAHIEPRYRRCTANDQKLIGARMAAVTQDNGWFQRWRLYHLVNCDDIEMQQRIEEWRQYLNAITAPLVDVADEGPEPEPPRPN